MNQAFFNEMDYSELGLRLLSLTIEAARPKEYYVDIPSGDGALDLTEALTGEVHYDDRNVEAVYRLQLGEDTQDIVERINNDLNGKKVTVHQPEKVGYHLLGRCSVAYRRRNHIYGELTITARCRPWYYKNNLTVRSATMGDSGTASLFLHNSRKRVIPTVTTSNEATISFRGKTIVATAGSHRFTNLVLTEGQNELALSGAAGTTVNFEYQEGAL